MVVPVSDSGSGSRQTRYITAREGLSSDTEAASQLGQEDVES